MDKKNSHVDNKGFINQLLDNSNDFYAKAFQQFNFYKKLLGTRVIVTRVKNESDYRDVFGYIYSSTLLDDSDKEEFEYMILINLNDMKSLFQKNIDQIEFFDNEFVIKVGDVITYTRRDQEFKFKVSKVETFSEAEGVLYRYTMMGMTEIDSFR